MLHTLPYDVLRLLFRTLDGSDVARALMTCKSCKLDGRTIFDNATFREIYTLVLHTYGSLLGLWASDHPYSGSVIEFRYDASYKGIIGEVWRFWLRAGPYDTADTWNKPGLPEYYTFFSISLPATQVPRRAVIQWHQYDALISMFYLTPNMHVLSETYQSVHIRKYTQSSCLPEFPDPGCMPWYDDTRGLPRLRVEPSPTFGLQSPDRLPRADFLYMARTPVRKLAALVFSHIPGSTYELFAMHEPDLHAQLQLEDARDIDFENDMPGSAQPVYRRFYPLRCPVLDGDDPADEQWHPASLEGVWFGAYAAHRTEVLYIFFDETAQAVRALKITGDPNVPRGAISWEFSLVDRVHADELPHGLVKARELFGDPASVRVYRGTGTISGPGFLDRQRGTSTDYIGIVSRDEIRVNWYDVDEGDAPRYRRYRGRELGSEISESQHLRLPAPWYRPQLA